VARKPLPPMRRIAKTGGPMSGRGLVKPKSGIQTKEQRKAEEDLELTPLELVSQAETELASINPSKETAKNIEWRQARMKSQQQMADANDTEYWIAVCFDTQDQKLEFLKQTGLLRHDEDKYFAYHEVVEAWNEGRAKKPLKLTPDGRGHHTLPVNRRWSRFAMPIEGPGE
jgi:hypothetical protein